MSDPRAKPCRCGKEPTVTTTRNLTQHYTEYEFDCGNPDCAFTPRLYSDMNLTRAGAIRLWNKLVVKSKEPK